MGLYHTVVPLANYFFYKQSIEKSAIKLQKLYREIYGKLYRMAMKKLKKYRLHIHAVQTVFLCGQYARVCALQQIPVTDAYRITRTPSTPETPSIFAATSSETVPSTSITV